VFANHGSTAPKSPFTTIVSQFTIVVYQHYTSMMSKLLVYNYGMSTYDSCKVTLPS